MEIEVHTDFMEPGVYVKNNAEITIESTLNKDILGSYTITYSAKIGSKSKKLVRTISVVDTTKPQIELQGAVDGFLCQKDSYVEEGFKAIDNYEGDISQHVLVKKIESGFKYSVSDSSGNLAELTRSFLKQDTLPPTLTLIGSETIKMGRNAQYYEYGIIASDNCGDLTNSVVITHNINPSVIGKYTVTYTATDQSGNSSTLYRFVEVADLPITTVYLTFDDGPNVNTIKVLDILKEYDMKATFFIVYRGSSYDYLVKRAYQEGHSMALHSYTHNYSTIYSSTSAFFNDLDAISDYLYDLTGLRSKLYRFPGGSSNTSSNFNPGIMTTLVKMVKQKGYHYFDWNVSTGDGNIKNSAESILRNARKNIKIGKISYVLMHDGPGHESTVEALPEILDYLRSINAVILPITMDTPETHHNVQN